MSTDSPIIIISQAIDRSHNSHRPYWIIPFICKTFNLFIPYRICTDTIQGVRQHTGLDPPRGIGEIPRAQTHLLSARFRRDGQTERSDRTAAATASSAASATSSDVSTLSLRSGSCAASSVTSPSAVRAAAIHAAAHVCGGSSGVPGAAALQATSGTCSVPTLLVHRIRTVLFACEFLFFTAAASQSVLSQCSAYSAASVPSADFRPTAASASDVASVLPAN